jgi:hypothetical protein
VLSDATRGSSQTTAAPSATAYSRSAALWKAGLRPMSTLWVTLGQWLFKRLWYTASLLAYCPRRSTRIGRPYGAAVSLGSSEAEVTRAFRPPAIVVARFMVSGCASS